MSRMKKILCILLAMASFLLATFAFTKALQNNLPSVGWLGTQDRSVVYRSPVAEPSETPQTTEPVQETEETLPPETQPSETLPPETQPTVPRIAYEQVPLYDQTAYPDIRYRSGTLATSGSNVTCLAMVASYLTGNEYLPDELASYFADHIGNSMQWLEYASDELQLPWEKAANIDVTVQALREGKVAIVLMNERSLFMNAQHFVVFTGISEEGKILVNDPYGPNYSDWNLQNALASGFKLTDLSGGYSGAWLYDPSAMPEAPFLYAAEENTDVFRYGDLELSQEDKDLIARLLCAEAESEPFEGQQAIAEVILNRMTAENFPDTVRGVIYAEGQFLAANNLYLAEPTHTQYEAIERAYNGPYVVDGDVVFFSQYAVNDNVWGTIGNHVFCHQW